MAQLSLLVFAMVAVTSTLCQTNRRDIGFGGCELMFCPRGQTCIESENCLGRRGCRPRPMCVDINPRGRCPRREIFGCRMFCSRTSDCRRGSLCCQGCCVRPILRGGRCPPDRCFNDRQCPVGMTCCGRCPRKCA